MSARRRCVLVAAALLAALGSTRPAGGRQGAAAPDFELLDPAGRSRRLSSYRGKVVVLLFGFTQCPDVCPTALLTLAQLMPRLGPASEDVQVLFVTLDPERDTARVMGAYTGGFDARFLGLRGDASATRRAAQAFGVEFERQPGRTPTSYTIDHTAGIFLLDKRGRPRFYLPYGATVAAVEKDVRRLLASSD
jgi:protein SCO1/2